MGSLVLESDEDNESLSLSSYEGETTTNSDQNPTTDDVAIGLKESRAVLYLRVIVILTIGIAAVGVSVAIYVLTSTSENSQFQQQFDGAASKVVTSFSEILGSKFSAIGSLALQCSIYVNGQPNMSWPEVTVKDFQIRSQAARELSGALFTRYIPVVKEEHRDSWEDFALAAAPSWLQDARDHLATQGISLDSTTNDFEHRGDGQERSVDFIFDFDETSTPIRGQGPAPYFPLWEESPTFGRDLSNWDMQNYPQFSPYVRHVMATGNMTIGGLDTAPIGDVTHPDLSTSYYSALLTLANGGVVVPYRGDPMSRIFVPIFDDISIANRTVVAIMFATFKWSVYFESLLPSNFPGLCVVLENDCNSTFTYEIIGEKAIFLGAGDLHETKYDHMMWSSRLGESIDRKSEKKPSKLDVELDQAVCAYTLRVYPIQELEDEYVTNLPVVVTWAVGVVFFFTGALFLAFNWIVERRQNLVMNQAKRSTAIVSSLFPEAVRDRLMNEETKNDEMMMSGKSRLQSFLSSESGDSYEMATSDSALQPIADLFPNCTVFFADIAGFTSWSSSRDPSQVFTLLQSIYQSWDELAKRHQVFKVETIGDSYLAVTGLPKPQKRHAVMMARFAQDCLTRFKEVTKTLEISLGPDTSNLGVRVGMHSGPCTADTVNTAARMESTGVPNQIQVSSTTADLLIEAGKETWVSPREDAVSAKGKGVMSTYWLTKKKRSESVGSSSAASYSGRSSIDDVDDTKEDRLVNWMTELFLRHATKIIARQDPSKVGRAKPEDLVYHLPAGQTSLDEVAEKIRLPKFDAKAAERAATRGTVDIDTTVKEQLREVILRIAEKYRNIPFHNFLHACHVTMAVEKFMNRIQAPDFNEIADHRKGLASQIHEYTHGITSDPITLLAIAFSALVHDADHRGCSNVQMAKEEEQMAALYGKKSIAEQNSLDVSWDIFMEDRYHKLRSTLFVDRAELLRFRQILVQVVLATDIFDKELSDTRKKRWDMAFSGDQNQMDELHNDLRATVVIEHIIQASDVSHTMQHWHIYQKWNRSLFVEMTEAYRNGRMEVDPATFWYEGELGFFSNYVIPLAKKLKECNVFGVSSDECLAYALQNRNEWKERGKEIVESMKETCTCCNV